MKIKICDLVIDKEEEDKEYNIPSIVVAVDEEKNEAVIIGVGGTRENVPLDSLRKTGDKYPAESIIPHPSKKEWKQLMKGGHLGIKRLVYNNTVVLDKLLRRIAMGLMELKREQRAKLTKIIFDPEDGEDIDE